MGLSAPLQQPLHKLDLVLKGLSQLISHYLTLACVSVPDYVSFILVSAGTNQTNMHMFFFLYFFFLTMFVAALRIHEGLVLL